MNSICKICLIVSCWLLAFGYLQAQNLVPNPSFETYTACPTAGDQIYYAIPWTGPTTNSTDYYNSCTSSSSGIPFSLNYPRTGNAMAGFWAAFNSPNYREYLQSSLSSSLQAGSCYFIKFYINFVENYSEIAVNNIGANISNATYPVNVPFPGTVLNIPYHALKFRNPIIIDTMNWVLVSGIYTAQGGEDHIIIGDFKDDSHTDSVNTKPNPQIPAYYLIDDVSVIPVDSISMPAYAGKDTTIVLGDSVFVGQQLYGLHCNWYCNNQLIDTNISGIYVKPIAKTSYVVEQNLCGLISYDTVTVDISTVGIKQFTNNKGISVYPNPANNKLQVAVSSEQITNVSIYDLLGNEMSAGHVEVVETSAQLDVSSLNNGVYFVEVKTIEGIYTKKIIVQH